MVNGLHKNLHVRALDIGGVGCFLFHWVDDLLICVEDVLLIMCKKTLNSKQISK